MTKLNKVAAIAMAFGVLGVGVAAPQIAAAQPPLNIRQEVAAHPNFVQAIHESEDALRHLRAAPDNFGGRKAAAIVQLQTAIHSMRAALFYRLHLDNAAIDAAQF